MFYFLLLNWTMLHMNMNLLKIKIDKLTKKYGKKIVYQNLNLTINNEKINFLVSPNGTGKSTLIKCILNLITYNGSITSNLLLYAYCPEKVQLPEFLKVKDFLNLFDVNFDKVKELLKKFKINEQLLFRNLSKGMNQKFY